MTQHDTQLEHHLEGFFAVGQAVGEMRSEGRAAGDFAAGQRSYRLGVVPTAGDFAAGQETDGGAGSQTQRGSFATGQAR